MYIYIFLQLHLDWSWIAEWVYAGIFAVGGKILVVVDELACAMHVQDGVIGTVSVVAIKVASGVHPGLLVWSDCDPRIVSSTKVSRGWS